MRTTTPHRIPPRPDHAPRPGAARDAAVATSRTVGTFAAGQSRSGMYEVASASPVGSYASGLTWGATTSHRSSAQEADREP